MVASSKINCPSPSVVTPERTTRSRTISKSPSSPSPSHRRSPRNHDNPDVSDSDDPSEIPDSQDTEVPTSHRFVSWIWNHGWFTEDDKWRCVRCNEPIVEFKV